MDRSNDGFLNDYASSGYVTLAKLEPGQTSSVFQVTGNGGTSGTWTVSQSILDSYDQLVPGLKAGSTWAAILLSEGVASATWSTSGNLSHAILAYGSP